MEPVIQVGKRGVTLRVRVTPRASRNALAGVQAGALRVRLTAPPVEGAANEALIAYLAELLGIARRQVSIASGLASRSKFVVIVGVDMEQARQRLGILEP